MAKYILALGPGFTAGADVDLVIETMRGHSLGRIIREGSAMPNTGVPGIIAGYGKERVVHAPADGTLHILHDIGDSVEKGELLGLIGEVKVPSPLSGLLRGILPDGFAVTKGLKWRMWTRGFRSTRTASRSPTRRAASAEACWKASFL